MKKIVLLLLLAAPIIGFAQTKPATSSADKGKKTNQTSENLDLSSNTIFYAEIVFYGESSTSIRIDMGLDFKAIISNKDDVKIIDLLTKRKYQSVAQALNAANSVGFEMVGSFDFDTRGGEEVHIILEKRITQTRTNTPTVVQDAKSPNVKRKK